MILETLETGRGDDRIHRIVVAMSSTLLLVVLALLHGCGGGSAANPVSDTTPVAEKGDLLITVTDAPGDFLMYAVDFVQLTLERSNGDVVEALPLATRIDFSELVEVTEFLTIASVPVGDYESVVLTLDYSGAEIIVQDESGAALSATAVDANGDALGVFDVRIDLGTTDAIRISAGRPAAFSLDFDLDASNDIDLGVKPPQVIVDAVLIATPELETDREHRIRGLLTDVDEAQQQFTLDLLPFHHRDGDFGGLSIAVDEATQYEIDGSGYTGAEGLSAMMALAENTPVVTNGRISDIGIIAHTVIAGSSVPWTDSDVVKGVVVAREGESLTVRGARIEFRDGAEVFRGEGTVLLGPGTTVTAPGIDNATLSPQSISVGQRILAFGELRDDRTLDATNDRILMLTNQLTAIVVDPQPLAVDLVLVNGRRPAIYDFSGTGVEPAMDADPAYYEIDTGALNVDGLDRGELVSVRGLVNEFGAAPADFVARSIVDVSIDSRGSVFKAHWPRGTQMPFHSVSASVIDVDLSESRELLSVRGVPVNLFATQANILLTAPGDETGVYAVKVRGNGEIHLYRNFADLAVELETQLDEGASLSHIAAHGRYNESTNELTTVRAGFVFTASEDN